MINEQLKKLYKFLFIIEIIMLIISLCISVGIAMIYLGSLLGLIVIAGAIVFYLVFYIIKIIKLSKVKNLDQYLKKAYLLSIVSIFFFLLSYIQLFYSGYLTEMIHHLSNYMISILFSLAIIHSIWNLASKKKDTELSNKCRKLTQIYHILIGLTLFYSFAEPIIDGASLDTLSTVINAIFLLFYSICYIHYLLLLFKVSRIETKI